MCLVVMLGAISDAVAQSPGSTPPVPIDAIAPRGAGEGASDLRGVVTRDPAFGLSYVCADVAIGEALALVACGTGSDFLYPDALDFRADELAHFRLDGGVYSNDWMRVLVGIGFAEVEVGRDRAGFVFDPEEAPEANEAAGPELAIGLDLALSPSETSLGLRLDAGAAWVPGFLEIGGRSSVIPFAVLTANGEF